MTTINSFRSRRGFLRLATIGFMVLATTTLNAQNTVNVLFVGNSYTEVNNLPQITADIARQMGHEMLWSSNTPGGCTFSQHCTNRSMTLIQSGGWDFVVLQEQSQYPSFPQQQVEAEVFPYAARLVDSVYAASPCAEPMFYMTWGRKNGDAGNAPYFPVLGTYEGMDSMLCERYMQMASDNDASLCPVGRVWRYLRENAPDLELYQSDGSHPSVAGTYAAACAFFVMFFGDDPLGIAYLPSGLSQENAAAIRQAVRQVVFLQRADWRRPQPVAAIELDHTEGYEATLVAHTQHADETRWDFGDGAWSNASDSIVVHTYADSGSFEVTLVASRHCMTDTSWTTVSIVGDTTSTTNIELVYSDKGLHIVPNPATARPKLFLDGKEVCPDDAEITVTTPDGRILPYRQLDSSDMPAGLYIVTLRQQGRICHGKFVKL